MPTSPHRSADVAERTARPAPFSDEVWTSEKLVWAATGAADSHPTQPEFPEHQGLIGQYAEHGPRPA